MIIDYSIFNHLSCYEEFEIKSSIYGIDKKEILKNLSDKYNTYENKIYLVLGGHLEWFSLKTGNKIDVPDIINGNFYCADNQLTSLKGCPKEVKGDFWCRYNQLTSLKGCPNEVNGDFDCQCNNLKNLDDLTTKIKGMIYSDFK